MESDLSSLTFVALLSVAASLAVTHTAAGPDHYIPFIALSRAGRWSLARTLVVTTLCGLGHVLSSIVLGVIAIIVGRQVLDQINWLQDQRGSIAGWLLLGFGVLYAVWGIWNAIRRRPHTHVHSHADGTVHSHLHTHTGEHLHVHATTEGGAPRNAMTPWILFTIFVFGPCEPMIPLLLAAAAKTSVMGIIIMSTLYAILTIATMLTFVVLAWFGLVRLASSVRLERFIHASAGAAIAACGFAMVFLGM